MPTTVSCVHVFAVRATLDPVTVFTTALEELRKSARRFTVCALEQRTQIWVAYWVFAANPEPVYEIPPDTAVVATVHVTRG